MILWRTTPVTLIGGALALVFTLVGQISRSGGFSRFSGLQSRKPHRQKPRFRLHLELLQRDALVTPQGLFSDTGNLLYNGRYYAH